MGCDIHCFAEVKIEGNWYLYDQIQIDRNYELFGFMAGVRSDSPSVLEVKGFPENASFMVKFEFDRWGSDAHTPSWISPREIGVVKQAFPDLFDVMGRKNPCHWLFGNSYEAFDLYREDYPEAIEDVRWVFWFDN